MAKKAFVTGGTGFLGIHVVEELLHKGWEVVALYRSEASKAKLDGFNVEWVKGSILDKESLKRGIPKDADTVIHLAGSTNYWNKYYPEQFETNVTGTHNVLQVAIEKKIESFVFTSSLASYGNLNGMLTEETKSVAPNKKHFYAYTKWLSEEEIKKASKEHGIRGVILHPAHIVGPHDENNWVGMFKQVYNDELPVIPSGFGPYAHVKDIAAAHVAAAEKGRAGEHYILGGVNATFLEFINAIQDAMGKPRTNKETPDFIIRLAEPFLGLWSKFTNKQPLLTPDLVLMLLKKVESNDSKAEKELGFSTCSLKEQVEDTYKWLLEEGILKGN